MARFDKNVILLEMRQIIEIFTISNSTRSGRSERSKGELLLSAFVVTLYQTFIEMHIF